MVSINEREYARVFMSYVRLRLSPQNGTHPGIVV